MHDIRLCSNEHSAILFKDIRQMLLFLVILHIHTLKKVHKIYKRDNNLNGTGGIMRCDGCAIAFFVCKQNTNKNHNRMNARCI